MGVFLLVYGDVLAILGTVNCWYWWAHDYFSTSNGFYKNYTKIREIIEYSRSQNIEDIFCLFGLLITPYPEDKDTTDDHSEVITNEHIQNKPIGIEANKRSIQVSSSKTTMMGLRKITILSNLSHQIRMTNNVYSKILNIKSMKVQ